MTNLLKGFISTFRGKEQKNNDFSDFFNKPAGDKAKVIRQVLREANEEQRKTVQKYRERQLSVN